MKSKKNHLDKMLKTRDNSYSIPEKRISEHPLSDNGIHQVDLSFDIHALDLCAPPVKKDSSMPPVGNFDPSHNTEISLTALAENHFLTNKISCDQGNLDNVLDCTLADLLSETIVSSTKNMLPDVSICENSLGNSDSVDDLSLLLNNSCDAATTFTLNSFQFSDFNCGKEKSDTGSHKGSRSDDFDSSISLNDLLLSESDTSESSLTRNPILGTSHILDDDSIPNIDLKMCLKNCKSKHDSVIERKSSLLDFGVSKKDFKSAAVKEDFEVGSRLRSFYTESQVLVPIFKNARPSLFSKALSCKLLSNKARSEKVKSIKRQLIQKHFHYAFISGEGRQDELRTCPVMDKSNFCVVNVKGHFEVKSISV